jgi:4-amino-4-deoxy-L-arabinose transferase-like glycosyltransferase
VPTSGETAASAQAPGIGQTSAAAKNAFADEARVQRARFLAIALLSALLLFPAIRGHGLAGYDDSFFSHEAKEMVRTGDWGNVRLNGEIILQIPPMFVWLQACSFKLFGINDAAAKLPAALLGFGTILLVYFLTLELAGEAWLSLLAMLVLASTQFFLKNATHAMTDVPFTFFFTLAIYFYVKGLKNSVYLTLAGLPLGLALLTRSVVGFLALGVILVHLVLTKRYTVLRSPRLICGVALALAIPSVWYVSQYRLHGAAFLASHLQFLSGRMHGEGITAGWTTILNFPVSLLKYYWPWLPFLVTGLVMEGRAAIREKDQTAMLLIVWVLLVLVPFSLAETRYPRYNMAVYPAFSILSAIALDHWIPVARRKMFFNAACGAVCAAICLTFLLAPKARADDILKLAPIAEANSSPGQRVLIYTYEDGREDYLYQFIWYSNRYAQLPAALNDLAVNLLRTERATVIIDKQSYKKLLPLIPGKAPQILGESEKLVCFRTH